MKKVCFAGALLAVLLAGGYVWLLPPGGLQSWWAQALAEEGVAARPEVRPENTKAADGKAYADGASPASAEDQSAQSAAAQTPSPALPPGQEQTLPGPAGQAEGSAEQAVQAGEQAADQAAAQEDSEESPGTVKGCIEKGDTITKILAATGSQGVQEYIDAARQVFSMRAFRQGQPYVVVTDTASGRIKRFEYEIDNSRRLVVEGTERPLARVEAIEYVVQLAAVTSVINDNLFQTVAQMGESPQLALRLAGLFGAEINFIRDLQEGDAFSVLLEKRYRDGQYKSYGRILAAHFTNKGKTFEAYLFRDGTGPANYYNRKGENLRKSLLQAPLAFTRITSRFTNSRMHPILGYSRPHPGVDYAAPVGTPVKAVGEGTVTGRSWAGGYGHQVIVRHSSGLESLYSHLSGYARNLKTGQRVSQGQVIGFVGSTGLSTGPHLDFRLRQKGRFINPAAAVNPRGEPVSPRAMPAFEKTMREELALLQGEKPLTGYSVDSIVPDTVTAPVKDAGADSPGGTAGESRKKNRKSGKKGRK